MKNKIKLLGIIALIAVIGFSFAACGGGDGGGGGNPQTVTYTGTSGGQTYTLTITGDTYELTVGANKSTGTVVSNASGGVITLKPSNADATFTATVSGSNITALNGTITWTDATTLTAPGALAGGSQSGGSVMTWTKVTNSPFASGEPIRAIAYGGGKFVAVGEINGKMAYSSDNGVSWTAITQSPFKNQVYAIAYGNGKFVAGGHNSRMATSSDGVDWTLVNISSALGNDVNHDTYSIAYGNGKFVAGGSGGKMVTSTDGTTWTAVADSAFGTASGGIFISVKGIAYGNNIFVAVGNSLNDSQGITIGKMATSTNGTTWTAVDISSIFGSNYEEVGINAIAFGSNGSTVNKFIVVGDRGKMATSTDGRTWTAVADNKFGTSVTGSSNIYDIAYGNNKFVAVGNRGKMATSSDGATWTAVTTSTFESTAINAIAYGNGTFVAAGGGGKIAYSSDGGSSNPQTVTYTGTASGTAYTLKITENTARYAAQSGDTYELTVGAKKSTGTVSNVSGGVLTLKPSNAATTFNATVSGSSLTAMNGTITWTDNTTAAGPGTFTGGGGGGGSSVGTFTLTDIPEKYNGKYAFCFVINTTGTEGAVGLQNLQTRTLPSISNRRVSMPLWIHDDYITTPTFSGNGSFGVIVSIFDSETYDDDEIELVTAIFVSVSFSGGNAPISWNNASSIMEE